ncbi:MAG: lipid A biosynthesis acyltransferase [Gammaproteobacteria bacterium]|nr:lipid A biosynthesis acyltransferase [Gammaproteobacteria bacterium]
MSQDWSVKKERSNPATLKLICWIALHTSRFFARFFLYPITFYFYLTSAQVRTASEHYLKRINGLTGNSWQVAKHIFYFSATILDRVYFLTDQFHRFDIKIHGIEHIETQQASGQGCILLGAHLGSFDLLRSLAIQNKMPFKILMYQDHNAMITQVFNSLNPELENSVINLANENAMLEMNECLNVGIMVGMLGDRYVKNDKRITCQLLGDDVEFPAGPLTLATITKAPVFFFCGVYCGKNKYEIYIEKIADGQKLARGERENYVKDTTQKYVSRIEYYLKKYPYNWFNFYDFWQDESNKNTY